MYYSLNFTHIALHVTHCKNTTIRMDNSASSSTGNDINSVEEEAMLLDNDEDKLGLDDDNYSDDDSEYICCDYFNDDDEEEDAVLGARFDGYRVRARAKLQEMIDNGEELTEEEQSFHDKSVAAKARHAKAVKESLKRKMETNPEETMASIRKKQRRSNTKQALQKPSKPPAAKRKSGVKRRDPSKRKHYHPRFKQLLESMFDVLVRTFGEEAMSSYYLNAGYNLLVETEVAAGRAIGDFELKRVGKNNDPIIIAIEFDEIAQEKLQKEAGNKSKLWIIREEHLLSPEDRTVAFDERSRLDKEEYVESVVSKVYQEGENRCEL